MVAAIMDISIIRYAMNPPKSLDVKTKNSISIRSEIKARIYKK